MNQISDSFWLFFSVQIYQGLIFTLPKQFRQNYAAEMSGVFRDCCRAAYARRGVFGLLGELVASVFDLLISAVKERIMILIGDERRLAFFLLTSILAVSGGLYAALADLRKDEVPGPVFMVFLFTFVLGFFRPSSFWLSGLIVGLMLPLIHFIARAKGWEIASATDAATPLWAFWALIPACIGSTFGAVCRSVFNRFSNRFR